MTVLLLAGVLIFAVLAVFLRDMLRAVICLLISSIFLGIVFFGLHAPYAGVFEISVVAGLIMVLFILTISLTGGRGDFESPFSLPVFLVLFVIFSYVVLIVIFKSGTAVGLVGVVDERGRFGEVLWIDRTLDMIGQISIIFAGVFVILSVIGKKKDDK
ncbi:MAG: NADH-quinone oxidoreductase subunit J [Candidatus Omnitrophica bacterium]|nr:NADH-quinone oxidoreductase subunit J [Candidatus Omnitrophota bacterium]